MPLNKEHTGFLLSSPDALDLLANPKQSIKNPEKAIALKYLPDFFSPCKMTHGWHVIRNAAGWGAQRPSPRVGGSDTTPSAACITWCSQVNSSRLHGALSSLITERPKPAVTRHPCRPQQDGLIRILRMSSELRQVGPAEDTEAAMPDSDQPPPCPGAPPPPPACVSPVQLYTTAGPRNL